MVGRTVFGLQLHSSSWVCFAKPLGLAVLQAYAFGCMLTLYNQHEQIWELPCSNGNLIRDLAVQYRWNINRLFSSTRSPCPTSSTSTHATKLTMSTENSFATRVFGSVERDEL